MRRISPISPSVFQLQNRVYVRRRAISRCACTPPVRSTNGSGVAGEHHQHFQHGDLVQVDSRRIQKTSTERSSR
jgi:hypothetical protein